jgi:NADH-quinone oxidoreductase subunit C
MAENETQKPEGASTPEGLPVTKASPKPAAAPAAKPDDAAPKPAASAAAKAGAAGAAKPAAKAPAAPPAPPGPPDPPPPAEVEVPAYLQALQAALPGAVVALSYHLKDWTVIVVPERAVDVATWLRDTDGARFDYCSDVTAVDWPTRAGARFDVVYCLYSTMLRHRVRMKARLDEGRPIGSVAGLWASANWLEREVYDMFGIAFTGHPDLRRILMPEEWQGHPQRKDYPLEGPGELILESPQEWLKLRQSFNEAEIE